LPASLDISGLEQLDLQGERVLVTGASGFIGAQLCRLLLALGAQVHGCWRHNPTPPGVIPWRADLAQPGAAAGLVDQARPALVYHLAAPVDLSRQPQAYEALRPGILDATHHLAQACLASDIRLVSAGTCEEYGAQQAPFSETSLPLPVSAYSCLKLAASQWLLAMQRVAGLRVTVLRPFLTYGPGQAPRRLVPMAVQKAVAGEILEITDGRQTRELNHVSDVARGIARAAAPQALGCLLNIGGGPELSVSELASTIYRLAGADPGLVRRGRLPRRAGEVERFYGDHARARRLLGHHPRVELQDGLLQTIEHARNHA